MKVKKFEVKNTETEVLENLQEDIKKELLKRQPKEQFKIFECGIVREVLKRLLDEGYKPGVIKEIYDLKKARKIKDQWYNTGTLYFEGEIKTATIEQLRDIENIYSKGGRLLCLGDFDGGLDGGLDDNGRFLGVATESLKNEKKIKKEIKQNQLL